jgi:hypothetical protein
MDRYSRFVSPDKAIQTVCVGGVYIIDKRIGYDRRHKMHKMHKVHKMHKWQKKYERRLSHWAKNFNRRRQFIDVFI